MNTNGCEWDVQNVCRKTRNHHYWMAYNTKDNKIIKKETENQYEKSQVCTIRSKMILKKLKGLNHTDFT